MKKKDFIKLLISFFISFILLYLLLSKTDINKYIEIGKNIQIEYLIIALVLYTFVLIVRAVRFRVLLKNKTSLSNMLDIVFVYNFLNYLLPFKLGELSYPFLIKKTKQGDYKEAFSSFIVARLFDFVVIVLMLFIGLIFSNPLKLDYNKSFFFTLVFLLSLICVIYSLFNPLFLISVLEKIWKNKILKLNFFANIKKNTFLFLKSFMSYKKKETIFSVFFLSLLSFGLGFFCYFFLIISLGFYLPLSILLFVVPMGVLSGIIPFGGIANFGTFESLWVISLIVLGYSLENAVLLSFSLHIIQLIYVAFLGFFGWVKLIKKI